MIKIRIKNADHEIDVQFPISENKLYAKLAEIHAIEGKDAPQSAFVTEVYWPEELSMLKDRFANLDELNYLARRMESFDYHEYDQFLIGITKLENPTEKDLINLTFNLDHFTLCKDVSSYGKIGREYVMNTEGAVPAHDEDDPKYAAIGKDLIDRGLAQITAKGLLIYNPREASEMFHSANSAQNPAFRGLWVHSLKTSDKVLKYGENNKVDFSEHPTVVKRGSVRTINIYAAVPDVA